MSENIDSLKQQVEACKAQLEKDEKVLAELQTHHDSLAESMGKLRQTLEVLEGQMMGSPQDEPSIQSSAIAGSNEQAFKEAFISEGPYPEQRLAGFVPLKVLSEERERLAGYIQTVRDSEFFDAQWYLETYPDIKDSGYAEDPAMHYLLFGGFEGRHPGPLFNSIAYYLESPDVYQNQLNPLVHYLLFGREEGRKIFPL
tara:strand:+ start:620 stop:1216 length:597 start_codon:yes stop_codon:yes gene_type:complete